MTKQLKYTTQLGAGLGLIEENLSILKLWEPGDVAADLIEKALESGEFPNITARRLQNIITECFATRFLKQTTPAANYIKPLTTKVSSHTLNQLFYLYTARANLIFRDFITQIYWEKYASGHSELDRENAFEFVYRATLDGKTKNLWSESTIKRNASYLMSISEDFKLLRSRNRQAKKFTPIRIETTTSIYLAYDLHFQGIADNNLLNHPDWQLFGLQAEDVREELKRLAVHKYWIIQTAANVVSISWAYKTMEEVIDVILET